SGPGTGGGGSAFEDCLPARFRQFTSQFTIPLRVVRELLAAPSTDIKSTNYTVAGIDPAHPNQGPVTTAQLGSGRFLNTTGANDVLANVAYANTNKLSVGSTVAINGATYHVVGLVNPTLNGQTADLYLPLSTLQKMATQTGRVNMVLVRAKSSSDVDA